MAEGNIKETRNGDTTNNGRYNVMISSITSNYRYYSTRTVDTVAGWRTMGFGVIFGEMPLIQMTQ